MRLAEFLADPAECPSTGHSSQPQQPVVDRDAALDTIPNYRQLFGAKGSAEVTAFKRRKLALQYAACLRPLLP